MAVPISHFAEEISILLLALWGIAGEPLLRQYSPPAPAVACCADADATPQFAPRSRGLVVRFIGIPFGFELSAALGIDRPFVLTLLSEPGPRLPTARPRLE